MKFGEIDIKLIRSKRKTISIFIERDGSVSARIPEKLSDDEVKEVFKAKEYQIHKNLAEWAQMNASKITRDYVSGQSFLYLGRNYRLKYVEENFKGVKLRNGKFLISKSLQKKSKELFISFYKEKLLEKLIPIINKYQDQLGVKASDIKVMELQNRWASCTNSGNVNFHWKCAMAPIDTLHYIVAHELVHLIHLNHTPEFWNDLDKISPNYDKHIQWLKLNGAGMEL
ncbi:M48 family metallopeptidase [Flammeovirga sp. OC4]|uniref:M48 family metallopeptidase n=1 Tax=Flammeovirga sp. OC4 TaxID=1382345 RepID=UPI0005C564D5|nr:SprT family zinc-dependent metalloprotease [Flammeovirga sp. OC4]